MWKCAWDVSAQSERHKNGSGETYRPEVNHFVWSLLCDTFFVPLVARKCIIIIRSFVILHRPLMGKKCIFYILFLKTFSSSRVSEYSVYSAFQNIQYFPCFRIFRVFRILEYSVCSAIPFRPSTIPSFRSPWLYSPLPSFLSFSSKPFPLSVRNTPYSKMATNKLFFCLHVNKPSLPHFHIKILLFFIHVDEANRAN